MNSLYKTIAWLTFVIATALPTAVNASMKISGVAKFTELRQDFYLAAIFSDYPVSVPVINLQGQNVALEMRILTKRWRPLRFQQMWSECLLINNDFDHLMHIGPTLDKIYNAITKPLKRGDHLRIEQQRSGQVILTLNKRQLWSGREGQLLTLMTRCWAGPKTPYGEFQTELLQGEKSPYFKLFNNLAPSTGRQKEVEQWPPPVDKLPLSSASNPTKTSKTSAQQTPSPNKPNLRPTSSLPHKNQPPTDSYRSQLLQRTYDNISYPNQASQERQQGIVVLKVTIDRQGHLRSIITKQGSRYPLLNHEAQSAVKRAEPYPPVPDHITGKEFQFVVPIQFRLP